MAVPGTTPLCQEHVIKKERKRGKMSKEIATHPHFCSTHGHAHANQQTSITQVLGALMKTFSTWHSEALNTPPTQPETWTVSGDIFKTLTQRSVTHLVFSVGG